MIRQGRSRTKRGRGDIIMGIESDSFTENVQPWQDFRAHTRRRRKFKRMAIGTQHCIIQFLNFIVCMVP